MEIMRVLINSLLPPPGQKKVHILSMTLLLYFLNVLLGWSPQSKLCLPPLRAQSCSMFGLMVIVLGLSRSAGVAVAWRGVCRFRGFLFCFSKAQRLSVWCGAPVL